MDFEKIFPFIMLLIFWGASSILRKMGRPDQKKQDPADQKPGFFKILQQHLADLEEKGKKEKIIAHDEYFQTHHQARYAELETETLIELAEKSLQQEPATTGSKTVSVQAPTGVAKPRPTILQKKPRAIMNRRKLQNAVIWAEILAPPVALRDQ